MTTYRAKPPRLIIRPAQEHAWCLIPIFGWVPLRRNLRMEILQRVFHRCHITPDQPLISRQIHTHWAINIACFLSGPHVGSRINSVEQVLYQLFQVLSLIEVIHVVSLIRYPVTRFARLADPDQMDIVFSADIVLSAITLYIAAFVPEDAVVFYRKLAGRDIDVQFHSVIENLLVSALRVRERLLYVEIHRLLRKGGLSSGIAFRAACP